jgi:predicted DNA-binding protein
MTITSETTMRQAGRASQTPYQRTQILLEAEQHAALKEMGEREGRSMSEIVREMVQAGLKDREAKIRQRLAVLEDLTALRRETEVIYGVYQGEDPIELVRRESAENLERVLRGLD